MNKLYEKTAVTYQLTNPKIQWTNPKIQWRNKLMNVYKRCTQSIKKLCWKWTMIAKKLKMKNQKTTNRQWIWWSINKEQVEVAMRQLIQYEAADACMCGWTWKGDMNGWGSMWGKQCDCEYKAWNLVCRMDGMELLVFYQILQCHIVRDRPGLHSINWTQFQEWKRSS